ncbi:MAG: hypothetical protein GY749_18735 [Desulfobacteraceae bacterium]|nr:hypothetical protein [Desulfobacteraceae bacterium]
MYYYLYDANGNVGQLANAADGSIAAHYEYDPFGNIIKAEGEYKDSNPSTALNSLFLMSRQPYFIFQYNTI